MKKEFEPISLGSTEIIILCAVVLFSLVSCVTVVALDFSRGKATEATFKAFRYIYRNAVASCVEAAYKNAAPFLSEKGTAEFSYRLQMINEDIGGPETPYLSSITSLWGYERHLAFLEDLDNTLKDLVAGDETLSSSPEIQRVHRLRELGLELRKTRFALKETANVHFRAYCFFHLGAFQQEICQLSSPGKKIPDKIASNDS